MSRWTDFEREVPKEKWVCYVLVLLENGDLEQETAIYYPEKGTFVMRASYEKPCGTTARILYWRKQRDED